MMLDQGHIFTATWVQSLSALFTGFYNYNVTFGRLKRNHLDAKPDGSVTAPVMLCHVSMHFLSIFIRKHTNFVK